MTRAAASPAILPVTGALPADQTVRNVASLPYQLAAATVENPGPVLGSSVESAQGMLTGTPTAVYQMFTDPAEAWDMMKQDYSARYGPLVRGDFKYFRDNVAENGGLTPYGLDFMITGAPVGKAVGAAGRAGALGRVAERFITKERPALLTKAGMPAEEQVISKNAGGVVAQRVLDRARAAKTTRRAAGRDLRGGDAFAKEAADRNAVIRVRHSHGLHKATAAIKSRARATMLIQQGRLLRQLNLILTHASKDQGKAIKWALALGIRTPEQARSVLTARIAAIKEARAGVDMSKYGGRLDNIPEIEHIIANADEIFTPEYGQSIDTLRATEKAYVAGSVKAGIRNDPALDLEQAANRRVAQQAEHLGVERVPGELSGTYINRVREAAREAGLAEPGYFKSELSRRRRFSQAAVGGAKHSEQTKHYTGSLFRLGIENNSPSVMLRSFQQNVKRRNSWDMVSAIAEQHSFPWSRNKQGHGLTQAEIVKYMIANGMDESSVVLWNPGLMRKQMGEEVMPGTARAANIGDDYMDDLSAAVQDVNGARSKAGSSEFETQQGWYAIPVEVQDELLASAKSGKIARTADVMMSKMSGYLLAFNTGWLGFQTISTAAQAAMAGVTPADWFLAQMFWHKKAKAAAATGPKTRYGLHIRRHKTPASAEEMLGDGRMDQLNAHAGISQAQDFQHPPQMGAAMTGGAVEGYRVFREGKWGQALHSANPIQAWFKLSQIPENANRRALAYKVLKSEAVKRMNADVKGIDAAITKVRAHMQLDPKGQISAVMGDMKVLEDMSDRLADFLGDYQTFTAKERAVFKRMIPFYSWMRFATKFALFTLPSKHPMATGLVYQLGRMETDTVREVLGDGMGWALGKMFLGDPRNPNSPFVDMYRGNPFLSGLSEFHDISDLQGFIPPYMAILLDPVMGHDSFTGQGLTVDGETMPRKFLERGFGNDLQIMFNKFLDSFAPYRTGAEIAYGGTPQSDDALPFTLPFGLGGPEPKKYAPGSGSETKDREEGDYQNYGGAWGVVRKRMLPFLPQDSTEIRSQANHMNAEYAKERQTINETKQRGRNGAQSSGTSMDDAIDAALERASGGGNSMDKAIDAALKRAGL